MIARRVVGAVLLGFSLLASRGLADGVYIPERAVQKLPAIPAQRALVRWKDGVETLVISSALDSEAQKLGWIIPVPTVPDKLEKQTPGMLKTLSLCIQPKITHDLYLDLRAVIVLAGIGIPLVAILLFKREWLLRFFVTLLVLFVLWSLMLPALSGVGSASLAATMQVEKTARVGSYDISVLRPKESADLNAWLEENGFASLPSEAGETIADYIARNWVFAAIKLTRTEGGTNAPHPIEMVFNATEAVYPLRLTALAGGATVFELFVIADQRASCELLEDEFCDRFEKNAEGRHPSPDAKLWYKGVATDIYLGQPALRQLMWDGCVLTKLAGTIGSNKMTDDIHFAWKPYRALQKHFYTESGAYQSGWLIFLWSAAAWTCLSMLICKLWTTRPGAIAMLLSLMLVLGFVLLGVGTIAFSASLPTLATSDVHITSGLGSFRHRSDLHWQFQRLFEEEPDLLQMGQSEIVDYLLDSLRRPDSRNGRTAANNIVGGDVTAEDSPGNFTVEKVDDTVVIRVYDAHGMAWVAKYPTAGPVPKMLQIEPGCP